MHFKKYVCFEKIKMPLELSRLRRLGPSFFSFFCGTTGPLVQPEVVFCSVGWSYLNYGFKKKKLWCRIVAFQVGIFACSVWDLFWGRFCLFCTPRHSIRLSSAIPLVTIFFPDETHLHSLCTGQTTGHPFRVTL